ncbi:beta-1,3-galactosyl-O-glycosyl-glycoprotein beta-1,6-N-acetylglucosaminyltransferase 4-like [Glandiceps talaboti]
MAQTSKKRKNLRNIFLGVLGLVIFSAMIVFLSQQILRISHLQKKIWRGRAISPRNLEDTKKYNICDNCGVEDVNISKQCDELLRGKLSQIQVNDINKKLSDRLPGDAYFIKSAQNCTSFRQARGYNKVWATTEEEFPLSFAISVYKSTHQVELLLRTIYRPWNSYCIHVDKRSGTDFHLAIHQIASCFNNVFIASASVPVVWASIYVLETERVCQRELLKRDRKWKYYINLTGQEFPLKTNREIVDILRQFHSTNDVMSYRLEDGSRSNKYRQNWHFRITPQRGIEVTNLKKTEPVPSNIKIYKGELHVALTRDFVKFLLIDPTSRAYYQWLNDTYCPDEHYYQSLSVLPYAPGTKNSPVNHIINRAKIWESSILTEECQSRNFIRTVCILGSSELPWLLRQPHLFANKFYGDDDPLALACLADEINRRTIHPLKLNLNFYKEFSEKRSWKITNNVNWFESKSGFL